ncbi:MAG TPA: hypothetical protein VFZ66_18175 [Herpetosiphonaceae bacterium]
MFRFKFAKLAIIPLLLLSLMPMSAARPAQAANGDLCFPETGRCISGRFRAYWEGNGGLAVFGYPTGPAIQERNRDTGKVYLTQWFERNRFELHPENKAPYDVLLGRLGDDMLQQRGIDWRKEARANAQAGCLYFDQTGRNVCDQASGIGFKTYWQTHGLEFDGRRGVSYAESLALFGLPLTEPRMETNSSGDRVLTQWFERARFEWHPNESNPAYRVLLGLLGNELRGPYTGLKLPTDAPWVRTGNQVVALANGLPTLTLPQHPSGGPPQVVVAPNGNRLAYSDAANPKTPAEQQLVVYDIDSGTRREFPLGKGGMVFGGVFSPDSQRFAYTVIYTDALSRYEFRVLDLQSGTSRVLLQGSAQPTPVVVAWNGGGLFVRKIIYASDAPPQGLFQVELQSGALQTIAEGTNYGAEPSPDGRTAALVTGRLAIGEPPQTALGVLDRSTGRTTTIVAQRQQYIGHVAWSPNGGKLLHTRTLNNGAEPSSIHVTNADGTGEQALRLDSGAFPGRLQDVVWRNNGALLLLVNDGPGQVSAFEVALSNFHPAAAKKVQTFGKDSEFPDEFVYVPR